jgi:hypothetical protein
MSIGAAGAVPLAILTGQTPENRLAMDMEDIWEDQHGTTAAFNVAELKPIARRNSPLLAIALMFVWAGRQYLAFL